MLSEEAASVKPGTREDIFAGDHAYLDEEFPEWRVLVQYKMRYLLLPGFVVPPNLYGPRTVTLMATCLAPSETPMCGYGAGGMFYCSDHLYTDQGYRYEPPAVSEERHLCAPWQRWSRHWRWRPGVDGVHSWVAVARSAMEKPFADRYHYLAKRSREKGIPPWED